MKKINLQDLSPEDRARVKTFCKIMAIGIARLQEDEVRKAVQANLCLNKEGCERVG